MPARILFVADAHGEVTRSDPERAKLFERHIERFREYLDNPDSISTEDMKELLAVSLGFLEHCATVIPILHDIAEQQAKELFRLRAGARFERRREDRTLM